MEAWVLNMTVGDLLIDFTILSTLLLTGTLLRRYVGFFQRFLIPNSLIAGFLGLILGVELLGIIQFEPTRMGAYVYHLLALTFISVGLHKSEQKHSFGVINLGFMQVSVMLIQGMVGLGIAVAVVLTLVPDLNPAIGMLLPLGFAMGPGIAYSIGQSWTAFGYADGGSMGLTIGAIGFLVAYFFGMMLVNRASKKGQLGTIPNHVRTGIRSSDDRPVGARLSFSGASVEPLAVHLALVGTIYLGTWLLTKFLASLLSSAGLAQEIPVLWSFHFIFANVIALTTRRFVLGGSRGDWIDEGMIHRITGTFAEFLIVTSIMGISLTFALRFALPLLLICFAGALLTYFFLKWTCRVIFSKYQFERFIGIFAQMTGTISSGLALLRVTDPEYRSPVAQELVLSSGIALLFGFPLLLIINMPFTVFGGSISGFLIVLSMMAGYLVLLLSAWALHFRNASSEKQE